MARRLIVGLIGLVAVAGSLLTVAVAQDAKKDEGKKDTKEIKGKVTKVDIDKMTFSIKPDAGEEMEFKIIKLSPAERRIGLSHKALAEEAERKEYDSYRESADGSATLADLFHAKDNS